MTSLLKLVEEPSSEFESELLRLTDRGVGDLAHVEPSVRQILEDVKREGDVAVKRYTERFDGRKTSTIFAREYDGAGALERIAPHIRQALTLAAERIRRFHEKQKERGFYYEGDEKTGDAGVRLGARPRAVRRAGVYAPGGKARYPSSVLMSAIPAQVAGVVDIVLATPAPDDLLMAAAHLSGVTAIVDAGGAQAIAALAFGTQTVPRVDKIVGPGNIYVACAKRLVLGYVDIDGIAGPSEILVVADRHANASIVAADLLSQAEHDEDAYPLLLTNDRALAIAVEREVVKQLSTLPRRGVAERSLRGRGCSLVVHSRARLFEVADQLAVEHVALHVERPDEAFEAIGAMGAAFVGDSTPEAAGDYLAGPSHVLPTGGAVRFGSPLGVYDFIARTSYIRYSREALVKHADSIVTLARAEGLEAHARAVLVRTETAKK